MCGVCDVEGVWEVCGMKLLFNIMFSLLKY